MIKKTKLHDYLTKQVIPVLTERCKKLGVPLPNSKEKMEKEKSEEKRMEMEQKNQEHLDQVSDGNE